MSEPRARELLERARQLCDAHAGNCDFLCLLTSDPPVRKPCSCGIHKLQADIDAYLAAPPAPDHAIIGPSMDVDFKKKKYEPLVPPAQPPRVTAEILALIEMLRPSHYYCEDSWYSCPLASEGCADDRKPKDKCDCGAAEANAKIDDALARLSAEREPGEAETTHG